MAKRIKALHKNDLSSKRRRKKKGKLFFIAITPLLIAVALTFLMRLDNLQVRNVQITETKRIPKETLEQIAKKELSGMYFGFLPRSNFLIYPKDKIESEIMNSSPAILSAKVSTLLDLSIKIDVKERLFSAFWCDVSERCYLMDENGIVFGNAEESEGLKFYGIIEGSPLSKKYGDQNFFQTLYNFTEHVTDLGLRPTKVKVLSAEQANIFFDDNSYLTINPGEKNKETLYNNLLLFINDQKNKNGGIMPKFQYIDARYGNKIFFKTEETKDINGEN